MLLKPLEGKAAHERRTVASGRSIDELVAQLAAYVEAELPGSAHLEHAVLGLPGKVTTDRQSCAISYLDPEAYVDFREIFRKLGVRRGILANDVECGTSGIAATPASQLELLCGESDAGRSGGPAVLGMPGTDLGLGILLPPGIMLASGKRLPWAVTIPSEGGHLPATIQPREEVELAVFQLTSDRVIGLPTWRHLLCGKAIPRLFGCLVDAKHRELREQPEPDGVEPDSVSRWAADPTHPCHHAACDTFAYYGRFLGRMMQSAALLVLAEGVYLGGDIVLANHDFLAPEFEKSFQRHDVHGELLRKLPVRLIKNPSLNLDGATRMAEDLWRLGGSERSA